MCIAYYAIYSCADKHKDTEDNPEGFGLRCIVPCFFAVYMSESRQEEQQQQQQQQYWRCPYEERENVFLLGEYDLNDVCMECS